MLLFFKAYRSDPIRSSGSSVSHGATHSMSYENTRGTLSYDELQKLDDFELANVVVFGNRSFRPLQHQTCKAFVQQQDCFVLMPTGGGKSLCYQVRLLPIGFPGYKMKLHK